MPPKADGALASSPLRIEAKTPQLEAPTNRRRDAPIETSETSATETRQHCRVGAPVALREASAQKQSGERPIEHHDWSNADEAVLRLATSENRDCELPPQRCGNVGGMKAPGSASGVVQNSGRRSVASLRPYTCVPRLMSSTTPTTLKFRFRQFPGNPATQNAETIFKTGSTSEFQKLTLSVSEILKFWIPDFLDLAEKWPSCIRVEPDNCRRIPRSIES